MFIAKWSYLARRIFTSVFKNVTMSLIELHLNISQQYVMSFRIRIRTAEGEENQNKNRYKPNIDRPLKCCSPLMQFFQACSHLPSTFNVHVSFACFHRQFTFARIRSDQRKIWPRSVRYLRFDIGGPVFYIWILCFPKVPYRGKIFLVLRPGPASWIEKALISASV